jgi:Fe2+ or Zn2+ uptake regulation protein
MTNQRRKILDYLRSVKTHPTAEMVYKDLKKELPSMTLATVYRNLNHLAEQGEILKFEVNCVSHFDGDLSFHQHCICCKCGKVKDLFEKKITNNTLKSLRITDFEPKSLNIIIYGTCKKCK